MPAPGRRASIAADALDRAGRACRWRLGDGAVLTIAANFGDATLPCPIRASRFVPAQPGGDLPGLTTCCRRMQRAGDSLEPPA